MSCIPGTVARFDVCLLRRRTLSAVVAVRMSLVRLFCHAAATTASNYRYNCCLRSVSQRRKFPPILTLSPGCHDNRGHRTRNLLTRVVGTQSA